MFHLGSYTSIPLEERGEGQEKAGGGLSVCVCNDWEGEHGTLIINHKPPLLILSHWSTAPDCLPVTISSWSNTSPCILLILTGNTNNLITMSLTTPRSQECPGFPFRILFVFLRFLIVIPKRYDNVFVFISSIHSFSPV